MRRPGTLTRQHGRLPSLVALAIGGLAVTQPGYGASGLEEVVVTATRRAVPLAATPLSIGPIDGESIGLLGATHSSEALNRVAGVMVQRGSGQESLTAIRSPVLTGAGSCGAFLFLENGIPIRPVGFCNVNEMLEINTEQADGIEVLRGTGSALYGSNAVHGTVNVLQATPPDLLAPRLTVQADSDQYSLVEAIARLPPRLTLEAGPDQYLRVGAAGRIDGDLAVLSAKGFFAHDGGWRADSGFEEGKFNATVNSIRSATPFRIDLAVTNLDQETAGFIIGKNAYRDETIARSNPNPEAYRDAQSARLTGLVTPQLANPAVRLELRPYLRWSRMEFLQHFLLGQPLERNGQDSFGLMSTLIWQGTDRWSATVGLDLEAARSFLYEFQDKPTTGGSAAANAIRPAGRHYDYEVDSQVAAVYGQLDWHLGSRLHLGLGARAEYVGYNYDNRMLAGNTNDQGVACRFGGCLYSRPADRRDSFFNVAPKATLAVDLAQGLMAYANLSRGFRPPEITELYRLQRQQTEARLDSEQIDSAEIGLKGQWSTTRFALAGFDMEKRNVILRESNGFNVSNGRTSHQGVEYELRWQALPSVEISGGGTWARHRYEFNRAVEGGERIVKGNDIDTAPREIQRAAITWRPWQALRTEAEWLRVGEYWVDAANAHRYPGHELLNLRAQWAVSPDWSLTLRLNNALDRDYADRADFAFGNYRYFPGRGRTLFAEVRWLIQGRTD